MKKKQIITLAVAVCLVFAMGIGATLAVLTQKTAVVTNTFTVGNGFAKDAVTLDEAKVDPDTHKADDAQPRVQTNRYNNIMQGDELDKDPQVHVAQGSASCYMFVNITGLDDLAAHGITTEIHASWTKADKTTGFDGIYRYKAVVPKSEAKQDLDKVFETLTVADEADIYGADGVAKTLENVTIQACAVQSENVDGWDAALKLAVWGTDSATTDTTAAAE